MTRNDHPAQTVGSVRPVLASIDRESRARLRAALIRRYRDIDLAEDALQEALVRALGAWTTDDIPRSPEAWLLAVAKRVTVDALRHEQARDRHSPLLGAEMIRSPTPSDLLDPAEQVAEAEQEPFPDDRLGMFFTCAHPALKTEDRIALTLRFVAGLTTTEIAHALLMPRPTLQQRVTRAKERIRKLGISFEVPSGALLQERLPDVRRVIYLLYSEGIARSTGEYHVRDDLTTEALRLANLLHTLLPQTAETTGLLALMLLTEARRPARTDASGRPIPLADQDRGLWNAEMRSSGLVLGEKAAALPDAESYAIQAAIAAVHAEADDFQRTDWRQIAVLYRMLEAYEPGPIVRFGRAVALGKAYGPEVGIRRLDEIAQDGRLARYRPFHIARAMTLEELGDRTSAEEAYRRAIGTQGNEAEELFLSTALAELRPSAE